MYCLRAGQQQRTEHFAGDPELLAVAQRDYAIGGSGTRRGRRPRAGRCR
ncbi:MAG: hypothetical protein U0232_18485 [Thermomicrobiales bacterium]